MQRLTDRGTLDEIHACLGAFATTAGAALTSTAAPTDPPAPADRSGNR